MREKVILENEKYKVIYKQCPFEEGHPYEFEADAPGEEGEDRFNLCDLVVDLIYETKPYAMWHCWLESLAHITAARHKEQLDKFIEIINRPGPFEPGGALYKGKD